MITQSLYSSLMLPQGMQLMHDVSQVDTKTSRSFGRAREMGLKTLNLLLKLNTERNSIKG